MTGVTPLEIISHSFNNSFTQINFIYADNQGLLADSEDSLQITAWKLFKIAGKWGNPEQWKCVEHLYNVCNISTMCGTSLQSVKIIIDGKVTEQIYRFKNLGSAFVDNGSD